MRFLTRLKSLQALEAAARHGSFVGAAAEMGVTPAAVGQLVRSLEVWAGYPLFKRTRSGTQRLVPVDEVKVALDEIAQGLDRLETGLKKLRGRKARSLVVVTASQAFVAHWLLPRLEDFEANHPDIEVRLDVAERLVDLEHSEADIGVRCGLGTWPGVKATHLMGEEIIAVCSPQLLPARKPTLAWLLQQTLIHDGMAHPGAEFPSWRDWLSRLGATAESTKRGLTINSTAAVIQAAVAGRGLALVRKALADEEIGAGRLHHLMPDNRWPVKWGYFVVASAKSLRRSEAKSFHDWLLEQAGSDRRAGAARRGAAGRDEHQPLARG